MDSLKQSLNECIFMNKSQNAENSGDTNQTEEMDQSLHELFLDQLADLQNAEKQLTRALPKMIEAANSEELRDAIKSHLKETEGHVSRLEEVAKVLDENLRQKTCPAMEGLIEEAGDLMQEQKGKPSLDAAIIAAAQKVEHYEIASYGTVRAWAEQMGHQEAVDLLQQTLDEESAADEKLAQIAETLADQEGSRE